VLRGQRWHARDAAVANRGLDARMGATEQRVEVIRRAARHGCVSLQMSSLAMLNAGSSFPASLRFGSPTEAGQIRLQVALNRSSHTKYGWIYEHSHNT
jgi:hypothetical protein